ncbi:MAG: class I SAM-dependent methyltransferase [Acidobacteriota bacterium]
MAQTAGSERREFKRTIGEDDLSRLKRDREEADRQYNEALTGVDRAMCAAPEFPHPPPSPDESQVARINEGWDILAVKPALPRGWRGRVLSAVWDFLFPLFERQQAFNSTLVDHVNRNIVTHREVTKASASTIAVLRDHVSQVLVFQHRLVSYLQQITPFVDTKHYESYGLNRRVSEDAMVGVYDLDRSVRSLTAGIHALADDTLKHIETMWARDHRYDGRITQVAQAVAALQQQTAALKRELERRVASPASVPPVGHAPAGRAERHTEAPAGQTDSGAAVDPWKYLGFEEAFRGSQDEIQARLQSYVPLFAGASEVLDVGCGRGEFLNLLRANGISARGIDVNAEMVDLCRSRGLDTDKADAVLYLSGLPDEALGGLAAIQVVEHFQPDYLLRFLDQAQRVLRPGALMILETVNAACWQAFFESYIRDITHVRPLHPDTLAYLVTASGFSEVSVRFSSAVPQSQRLQPTPRSVRDTAGPVGEALTALADQLDEIVQRLNDLMFSYMDYAVLARRS